MTECLIAFFLRGAFVQESANERLLAGEGEYWQYEELSMSGLH